jgi:hypothetical protein
VVFSGEGCEGAVVLKCWMSEEREPWRGGNDGGLGLKEGQCGSGKVG